MNFFITIEANSLQRESLAHLKGREKVWRKAVRWIRGLGYRTFSRPVVDQAGVVNMREQGDDEGENED